MGLPASLRHALQNFASARIGVLGDLMVDRFIYGTVSRISPEAPVPVVAVHQRLTQPGGAANVAANVLSLGGGLSLFGVLGDDEPAREMLAALADSGADVQGVLRLAGRPSTVKTRIVAQSQQVVRFDEEETGPLPPAAATQLLESVKRVLPTMSLLVISDYAKGVVGSAMARSLLDVCRAAGVPVIVDPKPVNAESFAGASVIKPNLGEALRLAGWEQAPDDESMHELCQLVGQRTGIPAVVVTAGGRGMFVLDGTEFTHIEGVAREVYDVAGAGDSVLAAMALGLAARLGITDAARLGNLAGSIAVGHLGIASVTHIELAGALEQQGHANAAS